MIGGPWTLLIKYFSSMKTEMLFSMFSAASLSLSVCVCEAWHLHHYRSLRDDPSDRMAESDVYTQKCKKNSCWFVFNFPFCVKLLPHVVFPLIISHKSFPGYYSQYYIRLHAACVCLRICRLSQNYVGYKEKQLHFISASCWPEKKTCAEKKLFQSAINKQTDSMKMYCCAIGSYVTMLLKYTTKSLCICLKSGFLTM